MAQYVLAGIAQCPNYARAEILADKLSINLPDFKVHKIVLSEAQWKEWLNNTCSTQGWSHGESPLIWRELVDRGGAGNYLGGWKEFSDMAGHWYNYSDTLDSGKVTEICGENKSSHKASVASSVKPTVTKTTIAVVGATLPLAYSTLPLLLGSCFEEHNLVLALQGDSSNILEGIQMELEDCAFPELHEITTTQSVASAVSTADYILVIDPLDTSSHPNKFQLIKAVNLFYKSLAEDLKGKMKPNTQVIISGYKSNLGGMLLRHYGASGGTITTVLNQDEQVMRSILARKLSVLPSDIVNVAVWGNVPVYDPASAVMATVCNHVGAITGPPNYQKTVAVALNEAAWEDKNVPSRDTRDKEVSELSGRSPVLSSALAIFRHISALATGSVSSTMGIVSEGQCGTTVGNVFGFPVSVSGEGVVIVKEYGELPETIKQLISLQDNMLLVEKKVALGECDDYESAMLHCEAALWSILESPKLKRELEERELTRLAAEEAERKAADARAKEEAKKKAEEEALKKAEEEAAAALAAEEAAQQLEEEEGDED